MSATPESLTPPATAELTLDAARGGRRGGARPRPRAWCRSTPPRCPGSTPRSQEYVESIVDPRRALARVRRQGGRRARRWATTTSAPRPTRRTGCWRRRCGPCSRARSAKAARSRPRCSTCAAPSRTSTRSRPRASRSCSGMIPFGDKIVDYFRKYESAQSHLDGIIKALYDGQDELRQDNAALEQEKLHLWETMQRLERSTSTSPSSSTPTLAAQDRRRSRRPIPRRRRRCATTCCSTSARSTRTC